MFDQNDGIVTPVSEAAAQARATAAPPRTPARIRMTLPPPSLLDKALDELATCLASLHVAEEALRVQNGVLKRYDLARRAERRRYLELFTSVPDALLVTDTDGLILEANPAAAFLLRGTASRGGPRLFIGNPVTRFIAQDERAALVGMLQAAGGGAAWGGCLWLQPRRGEVFRAFLTVTPISAVGNSPSALRWLIRPA